MVKKWLSGGKRIENVASRISPFFVRALNSRFVSIKLNSYVHKARLSGPIFIQKCRHKNGPFLGHHETQETSLLLNLLSAHLRKALTTRQVDHDRFRTARDMVKCDQEEEREISSKIIINK